MAVDTPTPDDRQFFRELAFPLVSKIASDEEEEFEHLTQAFFEHSGAPAVGEMDFDPEYGNGVDEVLLLLTPIIYAGLFAAFKTLLEALLDASKGELSDLFKERLKKLLRRKPESPSDTLTVQRSAAGEPAIIIISLDTSTPVRATIEAREVFSAVLTAAQMRGISASEGEEFAAQILSNLYGYAIDR